MLDQFAQFWPFVIALAVGFGVQVGLYTFLRNAVHAAHGSGKVVAVSGTTSGAAMVSCCAHYLVNLLPALGATGLITLVGQYQVELFWFGLAANAAGIGYVGSRVIRFAKEA
jgi:Cu+-exporting ATPase